MKSLFIIVFLFIFGFSFGQKATTQLDVQTINLNKNISPQVIEIKSTSIQNTTKQSYNFSNLTVKKEVIIPKKQSNTNQLLKTESTLNNINQNTAIDDLNLTVEKKSILKEKQNEKSISETKVIKN